MRRAGLLPLTGMAWLAVAGVLSMSVATRAEQPLEAYRWKHRLLLVFSPRVDDERARLLDDRLAARGCDISERDLLVVRVPADGQARVGASPLAPAVAANLRAGHAVAADAFVVLLIGKDGGTKVRTDGMPDLDALFGRIDGMPMRMAEMGQRGSRCGD